MSEFPNPSEKSERGFSVYYSRNDYGAFDFELESYQSAIMDWFKQCLDDTPSAYLSIPWNDWFKKWFSQFKEDSDE